MEKKEKIGLIKGGGTGPELVEVFKNVVTEIMKKLIKKNDIEFIECSHQFATYNELRDSSCEDIKKNVENDLKQLNLFLRDFYDKGGRKAFRTALNAETLYIFRRDAIALKTITLENLKNKRALIIRDESQGFYTNDDYSFDNEKLTFTGNFSKKNFETVVKFALEEGAKKLRQPFETWFVYKHHLFLNIIEKWGKEILPSIKVYQPNHATELLFNYFNDKKQKDILVIMGNESGDILHEVLIFVLNMGTRKTLHSREVCLHPELHGLVIYQTVHGSVDDVAGKNIVNPLATIRSAISLVSEIFSNASILDFSETAISEMIKKNVVTPDMGGKHKTTEVVDYFLDKIRRTRENGS